MENLDIIINNFFPGTFILIEGYKVMIGREMHEGYTKLFEEWGEI